MDIDKIKRAAGLLKNAGSVLFITGAGISVDSGLPTYRGIGGLYNDHVTEEGIPIETALAGETIMQRPEITWKYLARIEEGCRQATFNRAHQVIAEMEGRFQRLWVLTQNIDGFHQAAGSRHVIDIHGDFHKIVCMGCGWRTVVSDYEKLDMPPRCPECRKVVRPEVVLFGELLPQNKLQTLQEQLRKGFDVYFSVGTTSVFPYIQQPIWQAKAAGRPTIEINPAETEISSVVDIRLPMRASEALDAVWRAYREQ